MAAYIIDPNLVKRSELTGQTRSVVWGENVNAGQAVYRGTNNEYFLADSSVAGKPSTTEALALALSSGLTGQTGSVSAGVGAKIDLGVTTGATPMAAGDVVIVGAAGALQPAGDLASTHSLIQLGYAETDQILVLAPIATGVVKA